MSNLWENDKYMKESEHKHPELNHLESKDFLTWDEYKTFLVISLPLAITN